MFNGPIAHGISRIQAPFVGILFKPIIKNTSHLQITNAKIFHRIVRRGTHGQGDIGIKRNIVQGGSHNFKQHVGRLVTTSECISHTHSRIVTATIRRIDTLFHTILSGRGQTDALKFGVGSQVLLVQGFGLPPMQHDIGLCSISSGPNLCHGTVGISIGTGLFAITFHGDIQVMSLLWHVRRPSTRIIHNMTSTGIIVMDAIIFRRVAEISVKRGRLEIRFLFGGSHWWSFGHLVGGLTLIR
mmetsp:Transcript_21106/g.44103  ORF Transcript_21106/g.44103 Transcript_21106/m.44103 type:complete len:242 (-) Transcript_21106:71-796(-)